MNPTLKDRDILVMEKASIMFDNLEQGDIVAFKHQEGSKTAFFIKRIIGVPGNTVEIKNGKVYVNEELIEEEYLPKDLETLTPDGKEIRILLDEDQYFVLGDNRNNSLDSRFPNVGIVTKEQIISKRLCKLFNLPKL